MKKTPYRKLIQKATEHFRNVIAYCANKKFKRKITNYYIILDSTQQISENNNHATVDQIHVSRATTICFHDNSLFERNYLITIMRSNF